MAVLRKLGLVCLFALSTAFASGCSAGCGQPEWLLKVAGDSIGNDATGLNASASNQVCITRSFGD
ncbi:hypothetical protein [Mycobacterium nebraskense]|uniref:Uncharacterized protein n=1 Tax=Mycobacterium nebraskense TaxID=244292 RepID=A0A0F5NHI8_9MYCO|nr:hypothetical protein [Mycobacterium nebraskense]KKC05668.1 hypothetical protein WU83_07150 [Mycobacterium nebraskense]KLO41379.1 hypothetical protein ABW17_14160 [Mycobacterium nebraskense]MBI2693377.1 hypothetical protein [Mycobacterium nebraskense]MCV7119015.1 hypothetical protein [Mycobacterium nebraskense]ORW18185.1 hypothetical protein AWC17_10950 [Mycobacterium nebraskense]